MKAAIALAACALVVACAARRPPPVIPAEPVVTVVNVTPTASMPAPTIRDIWQVTLLSAAPLAQRGDIAGADSTLAMFAANYDGTCPSAEANYMRALLRLQPGNAKAAAEAIPLIDGYVASTCLAPGRAAEALLMRRFAVDLTRHVPMTDSTSAEEIRKLKEQLEQTKKELDRLKMRVIPPLH